MTLKTIWPSKWRSTLVARNLPCYKPPTLTWESGSNVSDDSDFQPHNVDGSLRKTVTTMIFIHPPYLPSDDPVPDSSNEFLAPVHHPVADRLSWSNERFNGLARPVTLGLRLQMSVRATTQHPTFNPKMMKTGRHRCILRLSGIRLHDPPAGNGRPKSVTLGSRLQWYLRRGYFQGFEQSGRSIFDVLMWLPETVYKTYTNPSTSILGYRSGKAL